MTTVERIERAVRRRLPSIASLQAFDAVARHRSFTRAASEIGVTQAAVTQHVKNLEEVLGVQLFVRTTGLVVMTNAARGYHDAIQTSLQDISSATSRLVEQGRADIVTVDCLGAFASKQLLPSLHEFRAAHPDVSLEVRTMVQFQGNANLESDVAIWHGLGNWPGVNAVRLFEEEIFPVCSPSLLASGPLDAPSDLVRHTIIQANSDILRDDWPFWLEAAGAGDLLFPRVLACDYLLITLQAAVCGVGVAIGRTGLVEDDLAAGSLVEPLGMRLPSPTSYYVVTPKGRQESDRVALVRNWLLDRFRHD